MRQRILTAAVAVLRDRGFAGMTTKEIARAAGISEGSIYNHFAGKTELIGATMFELAAGIREAVARLHSQVGERTVEDNLTDIARAEIAFFLDLLPITGPTLGDRDLLAWLRDRVQPAGGDLPTPPGPVLGNAMLIGYLDAEQQRGRLLPESNTAYLAAMLLGACQQYAFLSLVTRREVIAGVARLPDDHAEYARGVVRALLGRQIADD
jgi:AcrR family transcriptional regulator